MTSHSKIVNEIMTEFNKLTKTALLHSIKPNENLWTISKKYGLTLEQIYRVNPKLVGKDPSTLQIGEEINIPVSVKEFSYNLGGLPVERQIHIAAEFAGIDPKVFNAMLEVESRKCQDNLSPAGAMGCGQLMPETAKLFNLTDPNDPAQNLPASAMFFAQMLSDAPGTGQEKVWNALMMYNWGPGNFKQWKSSNFKSGITAEAKAHPKKVFDKLGWKVPEVYKWMYDLSISEPSPGLSKEDSE